MQPLVLKLSRSVDGFDGTRDGAGAPLIGLSDEASTKWEVATIRGASAQPIGRKTFHDMAAWWPTSSEALAGPMHRIPKIDFTHAPDFDPAAAHQTTGTIDSMKELEAKLPLRVEADMATSASWRNPDVMAGDLAKDIGYLKQRSGPFLLTRLVELGRGLPLFSDLTVALELEMVDSRAFAVGPVAQTYRARCK